MDEVNDSGLRDGRCAQARIARPHVALANHSFRTPSTTVAARTRAAHAPWSYWSTRSATARTTLRSHAPSHPCALAPSGSPARWPQRARPPRDVVGGGAGRDEVRRALEVAPREAPRDPEGDDPHAPRRPLHAHLDEALVEG